MSGTVGRVNLLTIGEIARRTGIDRQRVEYIIDSRAIRETGWAGNARVFTESVIEEVRKHAKRIEADKAREGE